MFTASLGVLLLRWLVPGPVGAADNGDAWRLLCPLGAAPPERISEDWVQVTYPATEVCDSTYVSSQTWFLRATQWLGGLFGSPAALDLHILGVILAHSRRPEQAGHPPGGIPGGFPPRSRPAARLA